MRTLIFCCLIFSVHAVSAQTNITVTHTIGKVYYYPPQANDPVDVFPGFTLSSEGRVRCSQGAKVKLLCKGKTFELSDTKIHFLDEIASESGNTSTLSFMGRFWMFLTGSMEGTEDEQHLDDHNKQSMENLHAGVKGFASKDFDIQAGVMYEGNLSDREVEFTWTTKENYHCCFRLTRQTDDSEVLSAWTKANSLRLNLADLSLEDGAVYEWQVITDASDHAAPHSRKMQFAYQPRIAAKALQAASSQSAYQTASASEQLLMEAFAMEENSFFYDTYKMYVRLNTEYPDDMLIRRAYAAFLARVDMMEEAKNMLR